MAAATFDFAVRTTDWVVAPSAPDGGQSKIPVGGHATSLSADS